MSRELIVAGTIVVACIAVTAIAFVKPGGKPPVEPAGSGTDFAMTDDPPYSGSGSIRVEPLSNDPFTDPGSSFPPTPGSAFPPTPATAGGNDPFVTPFPGSNGTVADPMALPPLTIKPPVIDMLPPPSEPVGERTHVVVRGDTLGELSKQYYGTTRQWKRIQEANQVNPDGLMVGQTLIIPAALTDASSTTSPGSGSGDTEGLYVVKSGDSYYRIALRELGDAGRMKEVERLNGVPPEDLKVGMKLKLPPRSGGTDPSPGSSSGSADIPDGARVHVVAKDEYLIDISEKYYGTTTKWKSIADANPGVNPNRLKVGQKLVIPNAGGSSGGSSSSDLVVGGEYTVKAGDILENIAQRELGDKSKWRDIAALNPGLDPKYLKVGQKLKMPAGGRSSSPDAGEPLIPSSSTTPLPPPPMFNVPSADFGVPSAPSIPSGPSIPVGAPSGTAPGGTSVPPMDPILNRDPWEDLPAPLPPTSNPVTPIEDPWRDLGTPSTR